MFGTDSVKCLETRFSPFFQVSSLVRNKSLNFLLKHGNFLQFRTYSDRVFYDYVTKNGLFSNGGGGGGIKL